MKIIGCDLHARQQTVVMLNVATGEIAEKPLRHEGDSVRESYSTLPRPSRVGIEATGSMQWWSGIVGGPAWGRYLRDANVVESVQAGIGIGTLHIFLSSAAPILFIRMEFLISTVFPTAGILGVIPAAILPSPFCQAFADVASVDFGITFDPAQE